MTYLPDTLRFLQKVCDAEGYDLDILDPHSGYLAEVRAGPKSFLTGAGKVCAYPLNSATACTIANDKAHTATLLKRAGISVPEGETFFLTEAWSVQRGEGRGVEDALEYAVGLGYPVVAKPVDGSQGKYVSWCPDEPSLRHALTAMKTAYPVALIQRPLQGEEYRLLVLDGELKLAYQRARACLIGDGTSTYETLLAAENTSRLANGLDVLGFEDGWLQNTNPQDIPAKDQKCNLAFAANISAGGGVSDVRESFTPEASKLAAIISDAIGLQVAGIDIIAPRGFAHAASWSVLEVNGNPSLSGLAKSGHEGKAIAFWRAISKKAFEG